MGTQTRATLTYSANPVGGFTTAQLVNKINAAAVPIPPELVTMLGGTVSIDSTVVSGTQAVRTIQWLFDNTFKSNFPANSDRSAPFKGIMTSAIEQGPLKSRIVEGLIVLDSP